MLSVFATLLVDDFSTSESLCSVFEPAVELAGRRSSSAADPRAAAQTLLLDLVRQKGGSTLSRSAEGEHLRADAHKYCARQRKMKPASGVKRARHSDRAPSGSPGLLHLFFLSPRRASSTSLAHLTSHHHHHHHRASFLLRTFTPPLSRSPTSEHAQLTLSPARLARRPPTPCRPSLTPRPTPAPATSARTRPRPRLSATRRARRARTTRSTRRTVARSPTTCVSLLPPCPRWLVELEPASLATKCRLAFADPPPAACRSLPRRARTRRARTSPTRPTRVSVPPRPTATSRRAVRRSTPRCVESLSPRRRRRCRFIVLTLFPPLPTPADPARGGGDARQEAELDGSASSWSSSRASGRAPCSVERVRLEAPCVAKCEHPRNSSACRILLSWAVSERERERSETSSSSSSPSSRGEMDRRSPAPRSLTSPGALAAAMSSTVFELVRAVPRSDPSRALLCGDGQASTRPLTLDASRSRSRRSAARRATTGASSARCVSPSCTRPAPCDAS